MKLLDAFDMNGPTYAFLLGGGDKAVLIHEIAGEVVARSGATIVTSSVRLTEPAPSSASMVVVDARTSAVAEALRSSRYATVGRSRARGGELDGLDLDAIDRLWDAGITNAVLATADAPTDRPLVAHAPPEPLISAKATHVVVVVGLSALGAPRDAANVVHPELLGQRAGLASGEAMTADAIAQALLHADGPLRAVPPDAAALLCITGVSGAKERKRARALAAAVRTQDTERRVRLVLGCDLRPEGAVVVRLG